MFRKQYSQRFGRGLQSSSRPLRKPIEVRGPGSIYAPIFLLSPFPVVSIDDRRDPSAS